MPWCSSEVGHNLKQLRHHLEISKLRLKGADSVGEFYSVAVAGKKQQADTGTKMVHIGHARVQQLFQKVFRLPAVIMLIEDW